jgi:hypothetical protein
MHRVLAGLFLLALARPSLADGLDPAQVPAGAKWVIHVDLRAVRQSQMGKAIHARFVKEERVQHALARMQNDFGFDPTKDLHSVTFYDDRFEAHRGVAMIELDNIDQDKLVAQLAQDKPGHTTTQHAGHTIYTWTEDEGRRHEHQVSGSFYGGRHVVFSRDTDKLANALDVLDDKAENLPGESPLSVDATPGAILVARAVGMAGLKTPFQSPVIRDARQLSMTFGEDDGDVFMQGMLVADSSETAARLREMIEGFYALAQVQAGKDPLAKKVMGGLNLVVADATIAGEWRAPIKDVLQLMETMHKKRRERAKQKRPDGRDPSKPDPADRNPAEKGEKRRPAEL